MQIAMVGLGRMGANMVRRLVRAEHQCVVFNRSQAPVTQMVDEGAIGSTSIADMVSKLQKPRAVWLMVPAGAVDDTVTELHKVLEPGDIVIDGGNSYYIDDLRRSRQVSSAGLRWVDVGTSGGIFGLERGYCLMIGGDPDIVRHLDPIFKALAPGRGTIEHT